MEKKIKANEEVRNDELKIAMITLKLQNDKESEDEFVKNLQQAYFLIPAVADDKQDEMTFMLLEDQNQNKYFQGYTDMDEYKKWSDANNSRHFILNFDDYANIVINSDDEVAGLVINPFSENIVLNKESLTNIFYMDKVFIDEVDKCPKDVENTIRKVLEKQDAVNKAYLMNMKKKNISGYLLIIDTKSRAKKKLFNEIFSEITNNIKQINIDIFSSTDNLVKDVIKNKTPFYKSNK